MTIQPTLVSSPNLCDGYQRSEASVVANQVFVHLLDTAEVWRPLQVTPEIGDQIPGRIIGNGGAREPLA
jgi:hypothetical protein